ncbi:hypothetical protein [Deinococcus ruber]|uniref:Uncharacterized protein n=1 Tax=Deinococcus ruber TaxID=1848197 RepID=A0A918FHM9_9DEIO|nr:hypothetical protein [Deinococcus ruber]GGR37905.1 hypothetical protein GCM10008957_54000 [Deinococcus ruber]
MADTLNATSIDLHEYQRRLQGLTVRPRTEPEPYAVDLAVIAESVAASLRIEGFDTTAQMLLDSPPDHGR